MAKSTANQDRPRRMSWLDATATPQIEAYAERLGTFVEAMADGKVDTEELKAQQARLVALMKKVEPALGDELHADVTSLLCELTAYTIMHTLHNLAGARPRFRG